MYSSHRHKRVLPIAILASVVFAQVSAAPLDEWVNEDLGTEALNSNKTSDTKILQGLGVTEEFIQQLTANFEKAVLEEKIKIDPDRLRQQQNGGGIGDFFGVGAGNNGNGFNNGEDEEDDEEVPPVGGPGPFGVLSGLFGLFSGIGTLNPRRVLQSTVNFFPPDQRQQAQMALEMVFGIRNDSALNGPLLNPSTILNFIPTSAPAQNSSLSSDNSSQVQMGPLAPTEAAKTESLKPEGPKMEAAKGEMSKMESKMSEVPMSEVGMPEASTANAVLSNAEKASTTRKPVKQFNEGPLDEDAGDPVDKVQSGSLEKEFAETADRFKTPKPKLATTTAKSGVEKDFAETGIKLALII